MEELSVSLKDCYGIKELVHKFSFGGGPNSACPNVYAIYARNGMMKTSFTKVFKAISKNKVNEVKDYIFDVAGSVDVTIDGSEIKPEDVFVISSYENKYESDISRLLVSPDVKAIINNLLAMKKELYAELNKYSGIKANELDQLLKTDLSWNDIGIFTYLKAFNFSQVLENPWLKNIKYTSIFDSSVLKLIKSEAFQTVIDEFIIDTNKIYDKYTFLRKGEFSISRLRDLCKQLKNNKFFDANSNVNQLVLGEFHVESIQALEQLLLDIDDIIKTSSALKTVESKLTTQKGMEFRECIEKYPDILEFLKVDKLEYFKTSFWNTYFVALNEIGEKIKDEVNHLGVKLDNISMEDSYWHKAISIFNNRFHLPYKMIIENLKASILGEALPIVLFKFEHNGTSVSLNRDELEKLDVLSQGEKRALYLLNIIFEMEKLKLEDKGRIIIIDDIADSFDYKNKYAIIEYLCDFSKEDKFKLIILSHNFDFYRSISSRLNLPRGNRYEVFKSNDGIKLEQEYYQKNVFNTWVNNPNIKNIIGLIPFVRNLIEYGQDKRVFNGQDKDYDVLTCLLHQKDRSNENTFKILQRIFNEYIDIGEFQIDENEYTIPVVDKILQLCSEITNTDLHLENKIILAIGIRHLAEKYMINQVINYHGDMLVDNEYNQISGADYFAQINKNQTRELFKAISLIESDTERISKLDAVNIMTPEEIHLNSFMYEPLLDMDIVELKDLYETIKGWSLDN